MSVANSSIKKGETLIDTAMTLNAMHPDILVVRHGEAGGTQLLAEKVHCAVINGGDGATSTQLRPSWMRLPSADGEVSLRD